MLFKDMGDTTVVIRYNLKKDESRLWLSKKCHLFCLALFYLIQISFSGFWGFFFLILHTSKNIVLLHSIEENGEQTSFMESLMGTVHLVTCWQQEKLYCSHFTLDSKI